MEKVKVGMGGKRKRKATEEAQAKGRHDRCLAGKKNLKVSFPLQSQGYDFLQDTTKQSKSP